jgi:hypothetical protein
MSHVITVEVVDATEADRYARGTTRAQFIRRAVAGGGALMVGGVAFGGLPAVATAQTPQDVEILNFALTLEYLEAEFYTRAEASGALSGETLRFAQVVGAHERAHVDFLVDALGPAAVARPTFDFKNTTNDPAAFRATAVAVEDLGVSAYNGQGPRISRALLAPAASIVSVEARHAAWIRDIVRQNPVPDAFDEARSMEQVLAAVGQTGFIAG